MTAKPLLKPLSGWAPCAFCSSAGAAIAPATQAAVSHPLPLTGGIYFVKQLSPIALSIFGNFWEIGPSIAVDRVEPAWAPHTGSTAQRHGETPPTGSVKQLAGCSLQPHYPAVCSIHCPSTCRHRKQLSISPHLHKVRETL